MRLIHVQIRTLNIQSSFENLFVWMAGDPKRLRSKVPEIGIEVVNFMSTSCYLGHIAVEKNCYLNLHSTQNFLNAAGGPLVNTSGASPLHLKAPDSVTQQ